MQQRHAQVYTDWRSCGRIAPRSEELVNHFAPGEDGTETSSGELGGGEGQGNELRNPCAKQKMAEDIPG